MDTSPALEADLEMRSVTVTKLFLNDCNVTVTHELTQRHHAQVVVWYVDSERQRRLLCYMGESRPVKIRTFEQKPVSSMAWVQREIIRGWIDGILRDAGSESNRHGVCLRKANDRNC